MEEKKKQLVKNLNKSIKSDFKLLTGKKTKKLFEVNSSSTEKNKSLSFVFEPKEKIKEEDGRPVEVFFNREDYEYTYEEEMSPTPLGIFMLSITAFFIGRSTNIYLVSLFFMLFFSIMQKNFIFFHWTRNNFVEKFIKYFMQKIGFVKINKRTEKKIMVENNTLSPKMNYINSIVHQIWLRYEKIISYEILALINENLKKISPRLSLHKFSIGKSPLKFDAFKSTIKDDRFICEFDLSLNKENQEDTFLVEVGYEIGGLVIPFRLSSLAFDLSFEISGTLSDILNLISPNLKRVAEEEDLQAIVPSPSLFSHMRMNYGSAIKIEPNLSINIRLLRLPNLSFNLVPLNVGNIMNFFQLKRIINYSLKKMHKQLSERPLKIHLFSQQPKFKIDRLTEHYAKKNIALIMQPEIISISIHTFMRNISTVEIILLNRTTHIMKRFVTKNKYYKKVEENISARYIDIYNSKYENIEGDELTVQFDFCTTTFDDVLILFYNDEGLFGTTHILRESFFNKNIYEPIYRCMKYHSGKSMNLKVENFIRQFYDLRSVFFGFCCMKVGIVNCTLNINYPCEEKNSCFSRFFSQKRKKRKKILIEKLDDSLHFRKKRAPTEKIIQFNIRSKIAGNFYVGYYNMHKKENKYFSGSQMKGIAEKKIEVKNEIYAKNWRREKLFFNFDADYFDNCSGKLCFCTNSVDRTKPLNFNHRNIPLKYFLLKKNIMLFDEISIENIKILNVPQKMKKERLRSIVRLEFLPMKLEKGIYQFIFSVNAYEQIIHIDSAFFENSQLIYIPNRNLSTVEFSLRILRNNIFYAHKNIKLNLHNKKIESPHKNSILNIYKSSSLIDNKITLSDSNLLENNQVKKSSSILNTEKNTSEDNLNFQYWNNGNSSSSKINLNISDIIKSSKSTANINKSNISTSALEMIRNRNEVSEIELPIAYDEKNESKEFGFFTEEIAEERSIQSGEQIEGTTIQYEAVDITAIDGKVLPVRLNVNREEVNKKENLNISHLFVIYLRPIDIPHDTFIEFLQDGEEIKNIPLTKQPAYIYAKNNPVLVNIYFMHKSEKIIFMHSILPQEDRKSLIFTVDQSHKKIKGIKFPLGTYRIHYRVESYSFPYQYIPMRKVGKLNFSLIGFNNLHNFHESICKKCNEYSTSTYKYFNIYLNNQSIYTSNTFASKNVFLDFLLQFNVQIFDRLKIVIFENRQDPQPECEMKDSKGLSADRLLSEKLTRSDLFTELINFYEQSATPIYSYEFTILDIFTTYGDYRKHMEDIYRRETKASIHFGIKFQ